MKDPKNEPKNTHWILVADGSRARLFETDSKLEDLIPIEALDHPESRLRVAELASDDAGSMREHGVGPHSSFERQSDPHRTTVDAFARELGDVVNGGRIAHRFEHLVLIAPPAFLGALRSHIDVASTRCVVASIASDWTSVPLHELAGRVRGGMPEVEVAVT